MIKIRSSELDRYKLDEEQKLWAYCGLDNCLTAELKPVFNPLLDPVREVYEFQRALQGPAMTLMRRGFKVDQKETELALNGDPNATYTLEECGPKGKYKDTTTAKIETRYRKLGVLRRISTLGGMAKDDTRKVGKWQIVDPTATLQVLAKVIWDKELNYHSPKQLQAFLYGAMRLPEQLKREKGKVKVSTDHEALEHLAGTYPKAATIVNAIKRLRDLEKLCDVLQKGIDADGRMRCSYNIAGTETGRWSSSTSVWDTGGNMQNIPKELRRIFVADPGYILFNADLEQAESRITAYLSKDSNYITACESADLHTTVAHMLFGIPDDKKYADSHYYYRHFTYRDMAKRAGHALNYGLSPNSLARQMHIPVQQAFRVYLLYLGGEMTLDRAAKLGLWDMPNKTKEGRFLYFKGAFEGIRRWHESTIEELELNGMLTTPLGRRRVFWARLNDAQTHREAIAFRPQSTIGDLLNLGLFRVWKELEPVVQILGQVHDSVCGQIPEKLVDEYAPRVLECLHNPIKVNGKTMIVPADIKFGKNWRDLHA